jgi:hypothetical protein
MTLTGFSFNREAKPVERHWRAHVDCCAREITGRSALARIDVVPDNPKFASEIRQLESFAQKAGIGWNYRRPIFPRLLICSNNNDLARTPPIHGTKIATSLHARAV